MNIRCTQPARECHCPEHEKRRVYQRRHKAEQRARELAERNRAATTCQKRRGPGICGAVLETRVGRQGETLVICARCERVSAGICQDCPRPVAGQRGKAVRCASCAAQARRESTRRYAELHRDEVNARGREYYQRDEERRRRRNEYKKKAYRKAHPDKVKDYKRAESLAEGKPRKRRLEYARRYNAMRAQAKREYALRRYYEEHPERPAPVCAGCATAIAWTPKPGGRQGRSPKWCDKCCTPAELKRREKVRARQATEPPAPRPDTYAGVKPVRVKHRQEVRYVDGFRLCMAPGCDRVVTGRKKKCARCRENDRQMGELLLGPAHRPRRVA